MNKDFIQIVQKQFLPDEATLVLRAGGVAAEVHAKQKRKSGEAYIVHPVAVASILIEWGMDSTTVMAALLHDTVEDTPLTLKEISIKFGDKVAELVDGVTKLGEVDNLPTSDKSTAARQAASSENIRKLLLAMTKDLRVIVIKLADRLHNLSTLKYLDVDDQTRIATESLEIYAPLADRLGMGEVKSQIEDLSFKYTQPEVYQTVEQLRSGYLKKASHYQTKLKRFIVSELREAGVDVISIESRAKHLYSIYRKLVKTDGDIEKIYDLMAVRIIVPEVSDCYRVLGILHQHFKPLIYRIKDYIAVPKPNGYRSLHTTVFALEGRIIEIQIRTEEMHLEAERGLAAHFYYDANKSSKAYLNRKALTLPSKFDWVSGVADLHASSSSGQEFVEDLKIDLFRDRIFVFSPKGDLYDLPEGSTPIDFAFAIHSDIGLRAQGARVNNRLVPLDTRLSNRDVVEVITRKLPLPSRDWLTKVKTPLARNKIKAWFRSLARKDNIVSGKEAVENQLKAWGYKSITDVGSEKLRMAEDALHYKDLDSLLAAVGEGSLAPGQYLRKLFPQSATKTPTHIKVKRPVGTGRVIVGGKSGLPYGLAPCCHPSFPQPIIGYITRGKGVTLHLPTCPNVPNESDRLVACKWEFSGHEDEHMVLPVEIEALNRVGLLRDLTGAIATLGVNISGLSSTAGGGSETTAVRLNVEVRDIFELAEVMKKLEQLPGVTKVGRISE